MSENFTLIDGKAVASDLRKTVQNNVFSMKSTPGLAVILVGEDPASQVYVNNKIKACEEVGIESFQHRLPENTSQQTLLELITKLNHDDNVNGILIQLPLPKHLDSQQAILTLDPIKDVDGLHPENIGRLVSGLDGFVPCTPEGVKILLKVVQEDMTGLHAVVIGRSLLFGKPMGQVLLNENCTLSQCHSRTRNIQEICAQADILIAAVGQPRMVKPDWVKDAAIVIDVGINRVEDPERPGKNKLVGDVDFDAVKSKTSAITPVPGGVGPMTIACLLANTLKAASVQSNTEAAPKKQSNASSL